MEPNNKTMQVVTDISRVEDDLIVTFSEIEIGTGKVKKSKKKKTISLVTDTPT